MGIIYMLAIFITYCVLRSNGLDMGTAGLVLVGIIGTLVLVYTVYRLIEDRVAR